jgi:hypothetical protein
MRKNVLLVAGAALAGLGALAVGGLAYPAVIQFDLSGAGIYYASIFWLGLVPGLVAGLLWGMGGGSGLRSLAAVLVVSFAAGVLAWVLVSVVQGVISHWRSLSPYSFFRLGRFSPLSGLILAFLATNLCSLWFGILKGRRISGRVAPSRVAVIGLVIAAIFGGAWLSRVRVLPGYGAWHVMYEYQGARYDRDYARAVRCFAPEYLQREFGSPPYAGKYRRACEGEAVSLGADERTSFCFHLSTHSGPVAGSNTRRVRIQYHYKTLDILSSAMRWTWFVTLKPKGLTWRIADMRLDRARTREWVGDDIEFAQGPAGTVRVLDVPEGWKASRAQAPPRITRGSPRPPPARGQ